MSRELSPHIQSFKKMKCGRKIILIMRKTQFWKSSFDIKNHNSNPQPTPFHCNKWKLVKCHSPYLAIRKTQPYKVSVEAPSFSIPQQKQSTACCHRVMCPHVPAGRWEHLPPSYHLRSWHAFQTPDNVVSSLGMIQKDLPSQTSFSSLITLR